MDENAGSRRPRRASLTALEVRLAAGERAAFDLAHRELAAGVRGFFGRRGLRRAEQLDDLSQQTWSQVWQSIVGGRYDPGIASISTFVYAVAHHVWLAHCRQQGASPSASPAAAGQRTTGDDGLVVVAAHAELLEALRECLMRTRGAGALSEEERCVVLGIADGATERELAQRLGLAPSTINARKKMAYERIRACLEAKGFSDDAVEQATPDVE